MNAAAFRLAVAFSCGLFASAQNLGYQPDAAWKVPPRAAARRNPLAGKPEAAGGGRKLFLRECVECHGQEGLGLEHKHSANFSLPAVQQQSDGSLFWKITKWKSRSRHALLQQAARAPALATRAPPAHAGSPRNQIPALKLQPPAE